MGSSPRASDIRIVLSAAANLAMIFTVEKALGENTRRIQALSLISFLASLNLCFTCGLKKPFKVVKEQS